MTTNSGSFNIVEKTSLAGQTVGKYRLQEALGAGGMATVYRAVQTPLERTVAIKVLHPHLTNQESFRDRFLREAKAVAALRHDHIVQVYDYDVQNGLCYIALEFLDGDSLEHKLLQLAQLTGQASPLPLAEALRITSQVARALAFAHQQGVIHRDVKPANIMQTRAGRTILTDFGIATILHETRLTVDGSTSGTPNYMSPEQALGERGDERSDIYSLGTVLYQLVTGRLPFEADTLYGLIMMHVNDTPVPAFKINPQVPAVVDHIIQKAMAKNPDDRYQSAAEFSADLEAALAGKTIEIKLPAQSKPARARWGWVAAVTGLALLGTSGAIGLAGLGISPATATPNPVAVVADKEPDFTRSMAAQTQTNQSFTDNFEDNRAGWPVSDGPVVRRLVEGTYQISVETPDVAVATVPKNLATYNRFRYSLKATLVDGQPESGYGLVFHRQNNDNYYVFAVNGLRQWSIWRLNNGVWRELRNLPNDQTWTDSALVLPPGTPNRLLLEVDGDTFNLIINDEPLFQLTDPDAPLTGGLVGIYMASSRQSDNALARARFDNLQLAPLDEFTTPSMAVEK